MKHDPILEISDVSYIRNAHEEYRKKNDIGWTCLRSQQTESGECLSCGFKPNREDRMAAKMFIEHTQWMR